MAVYRCISQKYNFCSPGDGTIHCLQHEGATQERDQGLRPRGQHAEGVPPLHVHQDLPGTLPQDRQVPQGTHTLI